ncbi:monooxygenase [Afipia sp. Root123D2]|uniref:flavin-containing monooxygenase n=1 Tax=Afipia sp. Root123D2 TaxID=1736436 RepID=UPI0006FABE7E|nr:NAD(P)-binding domain-containing protein [Afipia sp. Root123D2]KQW20801.1 monooxygenase [Afipia sp. Root123D2]
MTTLVIGMGPAGLAAVKSLKEAGLPVEAVERNADVGGQWLYGAPPSAVYASTHLISSKRTTAFADFPMPEDWPAYPSHVQVGEYFKAFAKHFDLYPLVRFNTEVRALEPQGQGWRATFSDGSSHDYTNVIIANGHLSDPLLPKIPGDFSGTVMHAKNYKTADIFEGKRVLVVGMGNTGCDIVVDAIHRAKQVLWSVRGGNYFVPKFLAGKPADEGNHKPKRFVIPKNLRSWLHEPILRFLVGPPERFGLPKPTHRLYDRTPIVNSLVLQHLGQGDVALRKPIKEFRGNSVVFADGREDEVDLVLLATGYEITFPFLADLDPLDWQRDRRAPKLFLNVFPAKDNGLFVAGLLEGAGVGWPGRALQTDLIAAYLKAKDDKRSAAETFRREITAWHSAPVDKSRGDHGIFVDFLQYKRDLQKAIARLR